MDSHFSQLPKAAGLYDPSQEKDNCGVGFIANFKSEASHKLVRDALIMLERMEHRGGCGCEPNTGDGAGVMVGFPHSFFHEKAAELFEVKNLVKGSLAVGNIFLPRDAEAREYWKSRFSFHFASRGLRVLGWREVPVDNSMIGPTALKSEPKTEQLFVMGNQDKFDKNKFELELYLVRQCVNREAEKAVFESPGNMSSPPVYVCTLSGETIVYKGQLTSYQVVQYYVDLQTPSFASHFALVHSRFSTNTFPSWDRAQPIRSMCHNGEINTLRGNKNLMMSREGVMVSPFLGQDTELLMPICSDLYSDSGNMDATLELLSKASNRSLPEAIMMMVPEAWQGNPNCTGDKRDFFEFQSCVVEPWDGPAMIAFANGKHLGCTLDRNGLRPHRYYVTKDTVIASSEVGVLPTIDEADVIEKGRLQPGKMFLVDFEKQGIVRDEVVKADLAVKYPYNKFLKENIMHLDKFASYQHRLPGIDAQRINSRLNMFGFTVETMSIILPPMVTEMKEALGSMGVDTPLACLSMQPRLIFDYFKQLFAQVTNPPMDSMREEIVMAMECPIGPEGNLLSTEGSQARRLVLSTPVLSLEHFDALKNLRQNDWLSVEIDATYAAHGTGNLNFELERMCVTAASAIIDTKATAIVLTHKLADSTRMPIPSVMACGALHHYLIQNKLRTKVAIVVHAGDAREVHHMCVLLGYGADAICPFMAYESLQVLNQEGKLQGPEGKTLPDSEIVKRYIKSTGKGIKKVMGKIGICCVQSYKGAQIFEAVGIGRDLVDKCFRGTASRIGGIGFAEIHQDICKMHYAAWPKDTKKAPLLANPGEFHFRHDAESHYNDPAVIVGIQTVARTNSRKAYADYKKVANTAASKCTIRGMLKFKSDPSRTIKIEDVEPASEIVKRFVTGAMSLGSISKETHETLAIAMNRLGGKSNTGEGGEDPARFAPMANGDSKRSSIKQIASGRFGVTSNYLSNADEIQIKMAQGAKPGEGGELPGIKVFDQIAKLRHATEGVGLISPPPHHDIYSIEDLAQLIHDAKNANPSARVSVKLVSEVGVGVVAAGVAKAKADHICVSGHDGGTGAAAWTGIKHAGLPWELGLAEAQHTLVLNNLRSRVVLQTDGQLKTGRDCAVAFLLGAEEVAFATAPLIALGCIMMRKCHLNTCPVGIATQDPELRRKFRGQPEHVMNFLFMLAEDIRGYMADMGFRTVLEMVGRADMLETDHSNPLVAKKKLDLRGLLINANNLNAEAIPRNSMKQDHGLEMALDNYLIEQSQPAIERRAPVQITAEVSNLNRTVGAMLSNKISMKYGELGLPKGTIDIKLKGHAGQSLGAFLARGITLQVEGDSNDYCGKGLSGGVLVVRPSEALAAGYKASDNMIVGNVCLYGATSGSAYFSGNAGERFCVRNSGAEVVVEGVGDHGCEYMTGGRVVILGNTGRNFGAGMSGGMAFVYDPHNAFKAKCNMELIDLDPLDEADLKTVYTDISAHTKFTKSVLGSSLLASWNESSKHFIKVFPRDLKEVMARKAAEKAAKKEGKDTRTSSSVTASPVSARDHGPSGDIEDILMGGGCTGTGVGHSKEVSESASWGGIVASPTSAGVVANVPRRDGSVGPINKAKGRGFIEYDRNPDPYRPVGQRKLDFEEINEPCETRDATERKKQAARCMDCGTPFCQTHQGCPINNLIPEWNDLVFKDNWKEAIDRLHKTNNFPEFTGRVCPAPCEGSCVAGLVDSPVTIKNIEYAIVDKAWKEGWIVPTPPLERTGLRVAVIGSGPAGLACADQLNKAGHTVTVYERADRIGGLLMYGIPNMKLDKRTIQRRVDLMAAEGVTFLTSQNIGVDVDPRQLRAENDALVLAVGATKPRDLPIKGRELKGVFPAMDFLHKNTKVLLDDGNGSIRKHDGTYITAKDKHVVVIGGGDTGCDCLGTSVRHGCKSLVNFELLPCPPDKRAENNPWPEWPLTLRTDYGHQEALDTFGKDPRTYQVLSKEFVGDENGNVVAIKTVQVAWDPKPTGGFNMREIPGSEKTWPADLVVLSMGFLGPEPTLLKALSLESDQRSNIKTPNNNYETSVSGVFAAGDCRRGQSLVVWAINEGRKAAESVDNYLMRRKSAHL